MVRGNFRARRAKISQKKRRQWSAREKLIVIAYYEQGHSKRSTADKFEIEPKQLRNWLKNKDQLMIVAPYVRKLVQAFNLPSNTTVEHRACMANGEKLPQMRHLYDYWMNNEAIKEYTPSGKIKRPSYSLVANWVKEKRGIEADDESHEESSDNDYEPGDNRSDDSDVNQMMTIITKNEELNMLQD
uniref:HTH psq-type domain-containing protein n=1 Tax=Rhizophagus irregularis (strain DAOM 181602 / DAOM 197198 / MUCL 43194) TaxID=747089 RepID=U9TU37_RHIID